MKLARKDRAFFKQRWWNLGDSRAMHGTKERRANATEILFTKPVIACVRDHVVISTDPLAVCHDDEHVEISPF